MATLKGTGAFKNVNLIVRVPKNGFVEEEGKLKGVFADVQIDQALKNPDNVLEGKSVADSNPHLVSKPAEYEKDGEKIKYISHTEYYTASQYDAIRKAAGAKIVGAKDNTKAGCELLGVCANLMKNAKGNLIIKTNDEMTPTNNPHFGAKTLEKQLKVTNAAKQVRAQQLAAKQAETEEVVEAEIVDEPEL